MGRRAAPTLSVGTTDRLRQAGTLPSARGEAALLSQAPGRAPIPSYVDYGYTDTSFQGTSLQQGATQLQSYPPQFQSRLPPAAQPAHPSPQRPQQQEQQQQQPPFNPYGQEVVYNFQQQQGPAHGPYGAVSPYPPRQSAAAIDALSGQFAVPQYFPAGEPTGSAVAGMVPPYMNSHLPPSAAYNHPGFMGRSSATAQPFPANMADLTTPLETAQQQQQPSPQQPQQPLQHQQPQPVAAESASTTVSNLSEAYGQFQRALRRILDHSRAGRLVQASRSLLETSEWLVTNARELGTSSLFIGLFLIPVETGRRPVSSQYADVSVVNFLVPSLEHQNSPVEEKGQITTSQQFHYCWEKGK